VNFQRTALTRSLRLYAKSALLLRTMHSQRVFSRNLYLRTISQKGFGVKNKKARSCVLWPKRESPLFFEKFTFFIRKLLLDKRLADEYTLKGF